jgi:hypothetical protein
VGELVGFGLARRQGEVRRRDGIVQGKE